MKVLQEDLLASLMMRRGFALCCLYLFRFSDEGFVLNFLRVAQHSLMNGSQKSAKNSSVNHSLSFQDIVVLGMVLFAMLMRVLVKWVLLDLYLTLGSVW